MQGKAQPVTMHVYIQFDLKLIFKNKVVHLVKNRKKSQFEQKFAREHKVLHSKSQSAKKFFNFT